MAAQSQSQQVPAQSNEQNVREQQQRPATQPGNNAPFYREVRSGKRHFVLRLPTAGLSPITVAAWLLTLPASLASLFVPQNPMHIPAKRMYV